MPTDGDEAVSDESIHTLMRDTAAILIQNNPVLFTEMQRRLGGGPWTTATEMLIRDWSEILFDWALRSENIACLMSAISDDARAFVYQTMRPVFVEAFVDIIKKRWIARQQSVN